MGHVEIPGKSLMYLLAAVTLPPMVFLLFRSVSRSSHPASIGLAVVLALLLVASGVAVWRQWTGRESEYSHAEAGITWNPVAYPGHAAKKRWLKTVRRLSDGDGEDD
ncbi:hypothetical protein [Halorientalis pallida]|uniref:Uncharacterized protein n=1 Tax=Halorientalis pallida TaxID=2479928 RepID=A0A498L994_9EURY|nr:hypothetical protein [Halorientalis pallida]RXK51733.1 hypothetical protein EAF64_03625 [Halorientalis pallida]